MVFSNGRLMRAFFIPNYFWVSSVVRNVDIYKLLMVLFIIMFVHFFRCQGSFGNDVQTEFCIMTSHRILEFETNWPDGTYCILKKGNCPIGEFTSLIVKSYYTKQ